jgi:hypothetical protein
MSTTTRTTWAGWHRPHYRAAWVKICESPDEDEAFNRLLDATRGGDKVVLRAGENPFETFRPKQRRRFYRRSVD